LSADRCFFVVVKGWWVNDEENSVGAIHESPLPIHDKSDETNSNILLSRYNSGVKTGKGSVRSGLSEENKSVSSQAFP
jgi:hypothetical protein